MGLHKLTERVHQEMWCYYISPLNTDHVLKRLYHHPHAQGAEPWNPFLAGGFLTVQFPHSLNV